MLVYEHVLILISLLIIIQLCYFLEGVKDINIYLLVIELGFLNAFMIFVDLFVDYYGFHWLFLTTKPQFFLKSMYKPGKN